MTRKLIHLLITALAILAVSQFVKGIHVDTFVTALIVSLVLGVINLLLRPILSLLTLPINILTLGLFGLVVNGLLFWFVSSFIAGFRVDNLLAAIFGALIVSVLSWLGNHLLHTE